MTNLCDQVARLQEIERREGQDMFAQLLLEGDQSNVRLFGWPRGSAAASPPQCLGVCLAASLPLKQHHPAQQGVQTHRCPGASQDCQI
jgi:hypothetical protein